MGCGESSANATNQAPKQEVQKNKPATTPTQAPKRQDGIPITAANFEKEDVKILTLGAGECGKTTLWRQLKIQYCGGFKESERRSLINAIRISIACDIKDLISAAERSCASLGQDIQGDVDFIKDLDANSPEDLDPQAAKMIAKVWNDPMIKTVYETANSIGIGENAHFFLDSVERIASQDYKPTDEDILKARIRTTGVSNLKFNIKEIPTLLVDVGGQKNERKAWNTCFKNVNFVLFVVSLSDFDQYLFEDDSVSRTKDSMDTFASIARTPLLADKPFFLVLNKFDIFKTKIKKNPEAFNNTYPGFEGDINDEKACLEHITKTFLSQIDDRPESAWIEPIPTCAMDPNSVCDLFQKIAKKVVELKQ